MASRDVAARVGEGESSRPGADGYPAVEAMAGLAQAAASEEAMLAFWKEAEIFRRSVEERPEEKRFVFFEGPPTANASPGVHHAIARLMKDLFCRYWTMKGYRVTRKAGWDTHGLPVEIEVEKKLGLEGKEQIEAYGIGRFNEACRNNVFTYETEWRRFTERFGFWLDLDDRYATLDNSYIESVWSLLQDFWKRDLIYRGYKVVPYCPRCETPLSSHEVSQGYKDVDDPSVFVRFPLEGAKGRSLLVWTTTPWTLISNVAVAVNPQETYVAVRLGQEELVLAEGRLEAVLGEEARSAIVERLAGGDLVGKRYTPLFTFTGEHADAYRVVAGDFVDLSEGTGLVHMAPAFGEDDFRTGQREGLPVLRPVDTRGAFTAEVTPWAGKTVKEADPEIIADLDKRGLLFRAETMTHSYPFCWRCQHYLIYFARETWYLRTTSFREELLRENARIGWVPEEMGSGRFGRWLEGNVDWALSRERYWGTPLNLWRCAACDTWTSIGTVEELRQLAGRAGSELPEPVDLHRPYVDELPVACPDCGGSMERTPEVLDCWFDSGSMPFAQWGYPVTGRTEFETHFPADFIAEGVDQTRGWFYSLLAISTLYRGETSYRNCLVSDLILDESGRKMSKSVGNTVSPWTIFEGPGADALRWYLAVVNPPWIPTRFSVKGVEEQAQKMLGTFRNVCAFFNTYVVIDRPERAAWSRPPETAHALDRWILSRLEGLVDEVRADLDGYQLTRGARKIQQFVLEELSNWYVRRSRRRFWREGSSEDKASAYHTLFWVIRRSARLMAPYVPFLAEETHRKIVRPLLDGAADSVHLETYPESVPSLRHPEIEGDMASLMAVVGLGRSARMARGIKVRQPLARLSARVPGDAAARARLESLADIVREELNVREIVFLDALPDAGNEDVLQSEGEVAVLLDTRLSPELRAEGLARELVNKIQFMRKKGGFRVTDRIAVALEGSPAILEALRVHEPFIREETLADTMSTGRAEGDVVKEWNINGEPATIALTRRS